MCHCHETVGNVSHSIVLFIPEKCLVFVDLTVAFPSVCVHDNPKIADLQAYNVSKCDVV